MKMQSKPKNGSCVESLLHFLRNICKKTRQELIIGLPTSTNIVEVEAVLRHKTIGNIRINRAKFHESYVTFGGPWQPEHEEAAWNLLVGTCTGFQKILEGKAAVRNIKPWRIFGFVSDSIDVNGLAKNVFGNDQTYYFVVTAGAILDPYITHIKLAALNNFLPEVSSVGPFIKVAIDVDSAVEIASSRLALAGRLAIFSGYAIFFHELAHILRGHALLNSSPQSGGGVTERIETYSDYHNLERRAIETDADYYAGLFMAKTFLTRGSQSQALGPEPKDQLFRLAIAVFVAYYSFDETSGYHSGITRIYVFLSGLCASIDGSAQEKARRIEKIIMSLIQFMKNAGFDVEDFSLADYTNLVHNTQPVIREMQAKFAAKRPLEWGHIKANGHK